MISMRTRDYIMFRPCSPRQRHICSSLHGPMLHPMQTSYAQNMYEARTDMQRSFIALPIF